MKKPAVVLFTLTNRSEQHTYAVYCLKAYALRFLKVKPKPAVHLQIYKVMKESYETDQVSIKVGAGQISKIAADILKKHPRLVGFSCNIVNTKAILKIAKKIRQKDPGVIIVMGGPEMHQYHFRDAKLFGEENPEVDVIALFEGEQIFLEILESQVYKKYGLERIKGIIYRDGKRLVKSAHRPPEDLSRLPSPFLAGVYPIKTKANEIIVENSRGCPYRCAYCSFPIGNNHYLRYFPVGRVQDDLKYLFRRRVKFLTISDSNFNINKVQTMRLLETIIKFNKDDYTKIRVFFNASREPITGEYLALLSRSKIRLILGVQTVNKDTLKTAHRYDNLKILENNLRLMDKHDVNYSLEFIYGLPGDGYEDIRNDINWIFRYNAKMVFFYRLVMIPGTYFYDHAEELGLGYDSSPPYKIMENARLSNTNIENIDKLLTMVYHFHNHPEYRKKIDLISKLYGLPHDRIFEMLSSWYTGTKKELLDRKSLEKISSRFFSRFFGNSALA